MRRQVYCAEGYALGTNILENHERRLHVCILSARNSHKHRHPKALRDKISVLDVLIANKTKRASIVGINAEMRLISVLDIVLVNSTGI
jgi:hypothetical protein